MWTSKMGRDDLIAITQGEYLKNQLLRPLESISDLKSPLTGLIGVWELKPSDGDLPNLLLLPETEKYDFFAWANAYLKLKPLTAFVRTLGFGDLIKLANAPPEADRWERGILGLVLAEALTYLDQPASKLSLRACAGTYSFAVGRSLLRVGGPESIKETGINWFRSREALGNRASRLALVHLEEVWSTVKQLVNSDDPDHMVSQTIVNSCQHLFQTGDITDTDWRALAKDTPVYDLRGVLKNTREERVLLLENFLRSLGTRTADRHEIAFLVGYLVSMIAPGTLDHWRLLSSIKQSLPTAGMWYGLCAGLRPESRLSSYGAGVGRLVSRELRRGVFLFEQPTCDIAVDELTVTGPFFKSEGAASSNTIEVEIFPGVSVPFRSNGTDQAQPELRSEPKSLTVPELSLDPAILDGLDDAIFELQEVRRAIKKRIPYSERNLFGKSRKKRPNR